MPDITVSNHCQNTERLDFQPLGCLLSLYPAIRLPSWPNGREPWHRCIPSPEQAIVQLVPGRTRARSGAWAHLRNYKSSVNQKISIWGRTLSDVVKQQIAANFTRLRPKPSS